MKRNTNNKRNNSAASDGDFSFKDIFLQIAGGFISNFFEQLKDQVMERTQEILHEVKRAATVTFLILFGVVFLFVGLANIIDVVVGIKGVGFLFIGFVIVFFGFFMNMITRRT